MSTSQLSVYFFLQAGLIIVACRDYAQTSRDWTAPVELERIESPDTAILAEVTHELAAGRSGVRRLSYRGEDTLLLSENQSTYIPLGVTHRLRNPGKVPLELIEVQSGSYLGEDDIVRFEDVYGRG